MEDFDLERKDILLRSDEKISSSFFVNTKMFK